MRFVPILLLNNLFYEIRSYYLIYSYEIVVFAISDYFLVPPPLSFLPLQSLLFRFFLLPFFISLPIPTVTDHHRCRPLFPFLLFPSRYSVPHIIPRISPFAYWMSLWIAEPPVDRWTVDRWTVDCCTVVDRSGLQCGSLNVLCGLLDPLLDSRIAQHDSLMPWTMDCSMTLFPSEHFFIIHIA
jgi:hypothetical protein